MNKLLLAVVVVAPLLTSCVVTPVAPGLPVVVELGAEPYYYQNGYYYYYNDNRWSYSHRKTGPWRELPRDRYPREIRRKGQDGLDRDRGRGSGDRDRDRNRDYRD